MKIDNIFVPRDRKIIALEVLMNEGLQNIKVK